MDYDDTTPTKGSVSIGSSMHGGAISTGDNSTARFTATPSAQQEKQHQELLEQIRLLRQNLSHLTSTPEATVVEV
ncbi:hypothetical protein ACFVWN_11120 [Nocardiopsis flavescens]|uniref:hypothetical protein n=1 Tax=Nocardiopsis flavescens TaxID=758803 RepID=UPI00365A468B